MAGISGMAGLVPGFGVRHTPIPIAGKLARSPDGAYGRHRASLTERDLSERSGSIRTRERFFTRSVLARRYPFCRITQGVTRGDPAR